MEKVQGLADKAADAAVKAEAPKVEATEAPVESIEVVAKEIDLDGLDTFTFQGKKYTPEELRNEIMMRQDYTKKTQELSKFRKFDENLDVDLAFVRKNPQSAERFKQIYPEKYHKLLDVILEHDEEEREAGREIAQTDLKDLPKPLLHALDRIRETEDKLAQVERYFHEQKVQANTGMIDHIFKVNMDKYPYANEDSVINRVQALIENNRENENFKVSEALWEKHFRHSHQENEKRFKERERLRIDEQLKKGERAKDSGPGGLAPGRERKKIALGDVADIMIQDLQSRG